MVLAILGVVLTIGLKSTGAYLSAEGRQTTVARLAGIDTALVNYVAVQRRLPCPADGKLTSVDALFGLERRDNLTGLCVIDAGPKPIMNRGVVPWVTLGISESESQDGWNNRVTYRTVSQLVTGFTLDDSLKMTACDPAGSLVVVAPAPTCNAACVVGASMSLCTKPSEFLTNRGIRIEDGSGVALLDPTSGTGAAYVLISHGENRAGAYGSTSQIQIGEPPNLPDAPAFEDRNKNRPNDTSGQPLTFFIDAPQNDSGGTAQFDDIVLRPTIMSVVTRAGLGPRAH